MQMYCNMCFAVFNRGFIEPLIWDLEKKFKPEKPVINVAAMGLFMTTIKAYCHKICNECVIYQATQSDDDNRRTAIAKTLSEIFDKTITPEEINCDGCLPDSKRLFKNCQDCSIRNRELASGQEAK